MSSGMFEQIRELMNEHAYMDGIDRSLERVQESAEVFTPTDLVIEILKYLDLSLLAPGKSVIDPACGDGQFLIAAKYVKTLVHGMSEEDALAEIYGVDIMRDNVELCKKRLGGGTILMGDALHPEVHIPGQTLAEHQLLANLIDPPEGGSHNRALNRPKTQSTGIQPLF